MNDHRTRQHESTASFIGVYRASVGEVYRYFRRATSGDRALAEDLTQETFTAVVRAFQDGRSDSLTMPWIMSVAHNKLVDHYRKRWREERKFALVTCNRRADEFAVSHPGDHATEALDLLRTLSARHRCVLEMRYINDLPVADIARALGANLAATQSTLARARRSLERSLIEARGA